MRVLHVDTATEWRGGQTQLLHLARAMPTCAVALPAGAALRGALSDAGVEVFDVGFRGSLRGTRALAAAIRRYRPDLIAAHTSHAHGHAVRVASVPVVVHRRLDFAPGWFSRRKYARARRYVAVSAAVAEVLAVRGIPRARIDVVYDGVDRAEIDAREADRDGVRTELRIDGPIVLAAGALVAHKGHRVAVDALCELPGWHLAIAGEGPLRGFLTRRARRLGVGRRLHLLGHREDLPRLLKSADVFVHPSTEEGMGQVVIEALIAGTPVVASRAGGLPEAVGRHGTLVPVGDASALARAIPAARGRSVDASAHLDGFSVASMVRGTLEAYERALVG